METSGYKEVELVARGGGPGYDSEGSRRLTANIEAVRTHVWTAAIWIVLTLMSVTVNAPHVL